MRFCPTCIGNKETSIEYHKSRTLADIRAQYHLRGKHPSWLHAQVRGFNRSWNADLLKEPCRKCGYSLHVELCHKRAISNFPETATLGEVNHPSNVIPLCPTHHWELDHKILVALAD